MKQSAKSPTEPAQQARKLQQRIRTWWKGVDKKKLWRNIRIAGGVGLFLVAALFAWYSKDLPTPGKIRERQVIESTKIFDRNGGLLYEVHGDENRTVLADQDIPLISKQASIAAEDRQFYEHFGVDFRGIARALFLDVFTGQRAGGSTITQQYVKNALLTNKKSFDRKIKELILSLEIETIFSKDEILTLYLNEIPYGSSIYGIQAASQSFFAKDAKDLKLEEAALLAAIPQRPTYFSPYGTHTDDLKARRDYILRTMVELGSISQADADAALATEIAVIPQSDTIKAPHFVFYVREQLVEKFGEQMVEEGGLRVTTTLDSQLQEQAEQAITAGMEKVRARGGSNAALVSVHPNSGEIVAMVGSADYFDSEHDGNVNVTVAQRQPGSSFKPIVYATAFKDKYNPASTIWDVSTDFGKYRPNNYSGNFRGPVSARFALANSLNIPAVKLLSLVSLDKALETAHAMGITTLNEPERYGLALVLGGGEVKPLDMATAFSVFANGGTYRPPISILKVETSSGTILDEHKAGTDEKDVLDPAIAYQITDILSDNNARSAVFGPRSSLYFPKHRVAAKTGTTQEFHDAWTVGYTPDISTAVWVGNNDNTGMKNADGSVVAAPIFHTFMQSALDSMENHEFVKPDSLKTVTVDKLSNKLPTDSSPDKITDLFAPWQIPKTVDDVHVKVKINKSNGKLATELTPESLVEEKTYTVVHSERPDNPAWENPVLDWARGNGIEVGTPPTENDDMYTDATIPTVKITDPDDGETVSGLFTAKATASAHFGVQSVSLTIDGIASGSDTSDPYTFPVQTSTIGTGDHSMVATVQDLNGATTSHTIRIHVEGDTKAPEDATNITAVPQSQSIFLSWQNPNDSDLERIKLYVSTVNNVLGTLYPTSIVVNPGSNSTFNVTGLAGNVKYYLTLRPVDSFGNENQSTHQESATTLP
ncbi:MAG: penicillin-binding protein [Patescibacteria group bacterium]